MKKTTFVKGGKGLKKGMSTLALTMAVTGSTIIPFNVFADTMEMNVEQVVKSKLVEMASNYDVDMERVDITTRYVDDQKMLSGVNLNLNKSEKDKDYTKKIYKNLKKDMKELTEYTSKEDLPGFLLSYVVSKSDQKLGYSVMERDATYAFINLTEINEEEILNDTLKKEIKLLKEKYKSILIENEGCKKCYHDEDHDVDHKPKEILGLTKIGWVSKIKKYDVSDLVMQALTLGVNDVSDVYEYECVLDEYTEGTEEEYKSSLETKYFYIDMPETDQSKQLEIAQKYADMHKIGNLESESVFINEEEL